MALSQLVLSAPFSPVGLRHNLTPPRALSSGNAARKKSCLVSTQISEPIVQRRSGNYKPSIWADEFLQSLDSDYKGDACGEQLEKLKEHARHLLKSTTGPSAQLELINDFERLGVGYLYEEEIKEVLNEIHKSIGRNNLGFNEDLYLTALCFRLLRQYSFEVSEDVFKVFMDKRGGFNTSLCSDKKALLSLYEASFHVFTSESILDKAKVFTTEHLKDVKGKGTDSRLAQLVKHSLEYPLHWSVERLEARWYIDFYESKEDMNPRLLDLAKLDYNVLQAIYQGDLKRTARWWRDLGLANKLDFSRDLIVESFLWTIGIIFLPSFSRCREELGKVNQLISTIDDIYDVYGFMDELELFTVAVEKWDTRAIENLPEYMKIGYLALFNTINELGYEVMREQGVNIIPYLKNLWTELCKTYLKEAKWLQSGYRPTLEEYLDHAWVSISGPVVNAHAYFSSKLKITKEALDCIENKAGIIQRSSMLLRLNDDLGTSTDEIARGDVPKSVQCYMNDTGASEFVAREHVKGLISETWKQVNEDLVTPSPFPKPFFTAAIGLGRMAQFIYRNGDGFGNSNEDTRESIKSLLVEPIPLKKM